MQQSNQPPKYVIPFAQNDASKATIPPTSADDTRASQSQGFPPRTGLPPEAGGVPPQKADMNGALNQLAGPILWALAGGRFPFDNAFASDSNIGGYPLGANLPAADARGEWYSTTNDNLANPDTVGTGWVPGYHYGTTALTGQTGGNVTLTPAQAAKRVITVAGTLTSNLVLIVPAWTYNWTVYNSTSGAFSVSIRTAAGSAAAVPQNGAPTPVVCDGTNCSLYAPNIAPATSGTQAARFDQTSGRLLNVQTFFNIGSFTYTPTPGTTTVIVEVQGGGGGGGGTASCGATQYSIGGGGGSGAYAKSRITVPAAGSPIVVGGQGAGGAGGATLGMQGATGGTSSFAGIVCPGGPGGSPGNQASNSQTTFAQTNGTAPVPTGGNLTAATGKTSTLGAGTSSGNTISGAGNDSVFGAGGRAVISVGGPGESSTCAGAGGSGASTVSNGSGVPGGAGAGGAVIIYEYA